jgi:hypothetical protein
MDGRTPVSIESMEDGALYIHDGVARVARYSRQQPGILAELDS